MKYVYKIVCVALAIAVIGVVIFTPIFGVRIKSDAAGLVVYAAAQRGDEDALREIEENGGELPDHISETTSLYDLAFGDTGTFFAGFSTYFDISENRQAQVLVAPIITFAISLCFVVACALAVLIFGIFAKNNRKLIYSSIAGIGASFLATKCFSVIEDILVSGRVTIADIILEWWAPLIGNIVEVKLLDTLTIVPAIFAVVIVWTLLYNYTLTPEQKRERKRLLGEDEV